MKPIRVVVLVFLAAVLPALTVHQAAAAPASGGHNDRITVTADNGLKWDQHNHTLTATGNALAVQGDTRLAADRLVAFYGSGQTGGKSGSGGMRIDRLEAFGTVVTLTGRDQTITANHQLSYDARTMIAHCPDGATVTQKSGRTMTAAALVATFVRKNGAVVLDRAKASGGVTITTADETAYGSQGNYDAKTGIATLTGSVRIVRNGDVYTGSRAVFDMTNGVNRLFGSGPHGRARAVITPQKNGPRRPAR